MALNLRPTGYFGRGSVEVEPSARPGESGIRRLDVAKGALVTQPAPGVDTISDIIDYVAKEHGNRNAMGWRDVLDVHEEKKDIKRVVDGKEVTVTKSWKYYELSDYKFIDYIQLKEAISEAARGLVELGAGPDDVVDMFAETSPNWQIIAHACALISTTTATAYDTLGESGLTHSLNEPKCIGIFTNPNLLPTLLKVLPNTPTVNFILHDGLPSSEVVDKIRALRPDNPIKVIHIDELRTIGRAKATSILEARRPNKDTTACIMYTSGSTGAPKGVCLTHGNLVAAVGAMYTVFRPHIPAGDRFLAYLPLAHVLEYVVELCAVFAGVTCGYARPKTLTDASVRKCQGDLSAFKPNIMFGVPAVWEMIRKAALGKVNQSGVLARNAFYLALEVKKWLGPYVPGVNWAIDATVLRKVKEAVGGHINFAVNGGAAVSRETQEFFNLAVMPLTQGYGLTETCGMCAFLPPELLSYGPVGIPAPCIEIKLLDCPDLGYFSSTDHPPSSPSSSSSSSMACAAHLPQGEILLRGASLTKGYFGRDDLNSDESIFTTDGWFRTGDVGQWNEDGTLSLIDRLKNLVKLQSGEYIALERLEAVNKSCNLVSNLCVYASSDMTQPIAIIFPHEHNLRHALVNAAAASSSSTPSSNSDSDPKTTPLSTLIHHALARQLTLDQCNALARKNGFARMETLFDVVLTAEEWTAENGMVTAAGKVNRGKVRDAVAGDVECIQRQKVK